jgi:hypothetical protein
MRLIRKDFYHCLCKLVDPLVFGAFVEQDNPGIGDGYVGFRPSQTDYRQAAGNPGNGAAAARRYGAAEEKKYIRCRETLDQRVSFDHSFHRDLYFALAQAGAKRLFSYVCVPAENQQPQLADFLSRTANDVNDLVSFAISGRSAGDTVHGDGRRQVKGVMVLFQ